MNKWDFFWLTGFIYPEDTKLFALQIANCKRLEYNDAVYIFDEVGAGKTVTAAFMAMHYMWNNSCKKVLVITTPTLIKDGQFRGDWYRRLPDALHGFIGDNVTFINNDYRRIADAAKNGRYGLVIIDEAHHFLNGGNESAKALEKLNADKVVFLTATPTRNLSNGGVNTESDKDLLRYADIASAITGKDVNGDRLKALPYSEDGKLICADFDIKSPVTRYFKDTTQLIGEDKRDESFKGHRMSPLLIEYDTFRYGKDSSKTAALQKFIIEHLRCKEGGADKKSRFIIFANHVDDGFPDSAGNIRKRLLEKREGCEDFPFGDSDIKVITGDNSAALEALSKEAEPPGILILSYKIAEQGVNLPQYNYVVNYHCPYSPAQLEQRFGRIDRLNSEYDNIYMCFLLAKFNIGGDVSLYSFDDRNTENFFNAVGLWSREVVSRIPSKNSCLTRELYSERTNYANSLKDFLAEKVSDEDYAAVCKYFAENGSESFNSLDENDPDDNDADITPAKVLLRFCRRHRLSSTDAGELRRMVEGADIAGVSEENKELLEAFFSSVESNNIFYRVGSGENSGLNSISANECAEEILKSENFRSFLNDFNDSIKGTFLVSRQRKVISEWFEREIMSSRLISVFPFDGYRRVVYTGLSEALGLGAADTRIIAEKCDELFMYLPIFNFLRRFEKELLNELYSIENVCVRLEKDMENYGLSEDFIAWWKDRRDNRSLELYGEDGRWHAGAILKLAYHYLRKESAATTFYKLNDNGQVTDFFHVEVEEAKKKNPFAEFELGLKEYFNGVTSERELSLLYVNACSIKSGGRRNCKACQCPDCRTEPDGEYYREIRETKYNCKLSYQSRFSERILENGGFWTGRADKYTKRASWPSREDDFSDFSTLSNYCNLSDICPRSDNPAPKLNVESDYWTIGILHDIYHYDHINFGYFKWGDVIPEWTEPDDDNAGNIIVHKLPDSIAVLPVYPNQFCELIPRNIW